MSDSSNLEAARTAPGGAAPGQSELGREVGARRTFAIISHPDAGKTTITEKLLLLGNAIQVAGTVKGKKGPHATSDWMEKTLSALSSRS